MAKNGLKESKIPIMAYNKGKIILQAWLLTGFSELWVILTHCALLYKAVSFVLKAIIGLFLQHYLVYWRAH